MKKVMWTLLALVAILAIVPKDSSAQTTGNTGVYTVQPGDNGWNLARQYYDDATTWRRIVDMNAFLQERGRVVEKEGKIILVLRPGEELIGLERLGVEAPTAVSIEELAPAASTAKAEAASPVAFNWWPVILSLLVISLFIGWGVWTTRKDKRVLTRLAAQKRAESERIREQREHELRLNPVTSGPPIVAGGVQPNETERLLRTLEAAAVTEYARMNPGVDRNSVRVDRIGPVEEGMISGEGMVGYADRARPRRIDPPQPGYRARFRFIRDGNVEREDNLMSLQGCMNPCYFGEGLSGFTFEPRQQVLPAPTPAPVVQLAPTAEMRSHSIREAAEAEGHSTVTMGGRTLVFDRGVHLIVDEETGAIGIEGTSFRMSLSPKRVKRAKSSRTTPQIAAATGTSDE